MMKNFIDSGNMAQTIGLIALGCKTATEIKKENGMSIQHINNILKFMEKKGALTSKKEGRIRTLEVSWINVLTALEKNYYFTIKENKYAGGLKFPGKIDILPGFLKVYEALDNSIPSIKIMPEKVQAEFISFFVSVTLIYLCAGLSLNKTYQKFISLMPYMTYFGKEKIHLNKWFEKFKKEKTENINSIMQ